MQEALAEIEQDKFEVFRLDGLALAYHDLGRKKESDAALAELIAKFHGDAAFQITEVFASPCPFPGSQYDSPADNARNHHAALQGRECNPV